VIHSNYVDHFFESIDVLFREEVPHEIGPVFGDDYLNGAERFNISARNIAEAMLS
jgi:hypothetical protein